MNSKTTKISTGKFKTREELERKIFWLKDNTVNPQSHIAKICEVTESTVVKILKSRTKY